MVGNILTVKKNKKHIKLKNSCCNGCNIGFLITKMKTYVHQTQSVLKMGTGFKESGPSADLQCLCHQATIENSSYKSDLKQCVIAEAKAHKTQALLRMSRTSKFYWF